MSVKNACAKRLLFANNCDRAKNVGPGLAAEYANKLGYLPAQFVRLALQSAVDRDGLEVFVTVEPRSRGADVRCEHNL